MRTIAKLFLAGIVAFLPLAILYGWLTATFRPTWEPVGVIGLGLLAGMGAMVGMYLMATIRKLDRDPADNPEGRIADSAGDYGFYAPYSWWPLFLGGSAAIVFLGLALTNHSGWWLFVIGVVFGVIALLGWTFEFFRGDAA